jgi:hypothetical protein
MPAALGRDAAVTVRAADLALRYLGIDRREAAAVPREPGDRVAFDVDVIELEHHGIALAAVCACALPQHGVDVSEVSLDTWRRIRTCRRCRWRRAPPPGAHGSPTPMAVGAHDFASRYLGGQSLARGALRQQHGDARDLLADVIELENYRIGLSAVHARLVTQVIEYLRSEGLLTFELGGI